MDLILGYPREDIAFTGLFMMDLKLQNKGIGSTAIMGCAKYFQALGFHKIRLGVDRDNPQSNDFWKKNGFTVTGKKEYILMELAL